MVEVIRLDRCDGRGARVWIRVSWQRILLGPGTPDGPGQSYYSTVDAALAHVDVASLVEIIELRPLAHQPRGGSGRSRRRLRPTATQR